MPKQLQQKTYRRRQKLTRAGKYLADLLGENGKPVITQFEFFQIIRRVYQDSPSKKLYLQHHSPSYDDYIRLRSDLKKGRRNQARSELQKTCPSSVSAFGPSRGKHCLSR